MEEKDEQNMVESGKSRRGRPRDKLQEDLGTVQTRGYREGKRCLCEGGVHAQYMVNHVPGDGGQRNPLEGGHGCVDAGKVGCHLGMSFLPVSYQRARVVARKTCAVSTLLRLYSAGVLYDPLCFAFGDAKYKPRAPECAGFYKTETAVNLICLELLIG